MSLQDIVFLAITGLTLLGGVLAVWPKNVFYNAMGLILCLFGVSGLFIFLNCEFLAVIEIIIYIGAIAIAIIFAIMLSKPWFHQQQTRSGPKVSRSLLSAALLFTALMQVVRGTAWLSTSTEGDYSIRAIGRPLLSTYALPFEVVSLILLVAIIGALVISSAKEPAS